MDVEQWSPVARDLVGSAANDLVDAIHVHVRTLLAMKGRQSETGEIFRSAETLGRTALRFADAQFDLTGIAAPFGVLGHGEDREDEDDAEPADATIGDGLSILRRDDYIIVDANAVIAEGRRCYLKVWPEDTEEDAASDVTTVGRAIYQVGHAGGSWDTLTNVAGLQPTGRITRVTQTADLLRGSVEKWPEDPFGGRPADKIIYRQNDVFFD